LGEKKETSWTKPKIRERERKKKQAGLNKKSEREKRNKLD